MAPRDMQGCGVSVRLCMWLALAGEGGVDGHDIFPEGIACYDWRVRGHEIWMGGLGPDMSV